MKTLNKAMTFATWLAKLPAGVAAILIGGMMVLVSLDVVLKYLLAAPVPMTLELVAAYFMPAICFLPLGNVTRTESHLEVELFTQNLSGRPLSAIKLIGCVIGIAYSAVLIDQGVEQAIKMTSRGEYWELSSIAFPVWPARWFVPVGVSLMLLWLILQAIQHICILFNVQGFDAPATAGNTAADETTEQEKDE
ncbi:TRAP-type C4-dicarboxylate transport system, small permease component [Lutimaribacter pacificus]|uniref:TRAP transporter small permease protein n=1 Tax=Lutimaribacter pacificus TaxID=391948 RepID=A0A1H0L5M8_9RHOB|nr:TRAP transporter small permease [Lutimaribacter pacificus]SDO63260.1 TRAP-type C4-dicarboxylate transport system, small permease component [Lutimaribacter pacificus]SHK70839.1 TRAP-type C4-dicarboxylate transport system, small permease component [Lutimaribacter pacificus]